MIYKYLSRKSGEKKHERREILINSLFIIIIIITIFLVTKSYISKERYIYSWDYIGYQTGTDILITEFRKSILNGIVEFISALFSDYSKIYCIPIIPIYILLGETRLAFILSLGLVYITTFSIIIGVVFSNIVLENRRKAFWLSTIITLLTPSVWIPILRGYPDLGGASIFMIGILLYWKDPSLENNKQPLKIAGVMSTMVFYRRHFAYAFRGFIFAIVIQNLLGFMGIIKAKKYSKIEIIRFAKRLSILLLIFFAFSIHLIIKTYYFNYRELYASYEESYLVNINYYAGAFGYIFILISACGYILGIYFKTLNRDRLYFLTLLGLITIVQWIVYSRQISVHYTTHFVPFYTIGVSSFAWSLENKLRNLWSRRKIYLITSALIGAILLIINFNIGIGKIIWNIQSIRTLFARHENPLIRTDFVQLTQLITYLRENSRLRPGIYVAASSYDVLNKSIMEEAEKNIYGKKTLNIIRTSDIDSRDFYPLNGLLKANFVLLSEPIQYHINPREQKVISSIGEIFRNNILISKDFEEIPVKFILEKGIIIKIYKRKYKTKFSTILSTIKYLRTNINRVPGRETYWLTLDSAQPTEVERDALFKTVHISPLVVRNTSSTSLLYFGSLHEKINVNGSINEMENCPHFPIIMKFSALNSMQLILEEKSFVYTPGNRKSFSINLSGENTKWIKLTLQYKTQTVSSCKIAINHIVVSE